jgi:beta-glucanase (GH16 family)
MNALLFVALLPLGFDDPKWKLVWSDEFEGAAIDRKKWDFDLGNGFDADGHWISGWGNDELQFYTDRPQNAFVKDGSLIIRAIKEEHQNFKYTSARLKTRAKDKSELFSKLYGKFEFRAKLPTGQGVWPALWMMPQSDKYGGWPRSGEIDVMEARGQAPNKVLGTLHYGAVAPRNIHTGKDYILPNKGTIADFHVYAVEWEPGEIRWSVDGKEYQLQRDWWSAKAKGKRDERNAWPAPFDQPFYLIMNVAVGGRFLGNPDATTKFPVEMAVDYVRVYDKVGGYGKAKRNGK